MSRYMEGLSDNIFSNLDIDSLDRSGVQEYLNYLKEIDPQLPTTYDRVRFQSLQIALKERLVELDRQLVQAYSKNGLLLAKEKKQPTDSPE